MSDALTAGRRAIESEAAGLTQLAASLNGDFARAVDLMFQATGRVVITGVGKSGHVGAKIAATMASTGTRAQFVHAAEASHGDLGMIDRQDVIIALSKSGESAELADIIAYAKRFSIPLIAITAVATSSLGSAADICLTLPDASEATDNVAAPTTSTTMTLALGDALAVALLERRGFGPHDFRLFHPGGKLGARLKLVRDLMHSGDAMPLVTPGTAMTDVLLVMSAKRLGCTGVVDAAGALAGIITDGDLRRHGGDIAGKTAADVMSASPKTIAPHVLAAEALAQMNTLSITTLFAIEGSKPVGIIHLHDLLRAGVA